MTAVAPGKLRPSGMNYAPRAAFDEDSRHPSVKCWKHVVIEPDPLSSAHLSLMGLISGNTDDVAQFPKPSQAR
jgi:hypothetical protein